MRTKVPITRKRDGKYEAIALDGTRYIHVSTGGKTYDRGSNAAKRQFREMKRLRGY